mgnify:CR=1 FL=1
MKKVILIILSILVFIPGIIAQTVPNGMNYQAVARDLTGEIIADQEVFLKIHLHSGENTSLKYYTEAHKPTTNQFGLFSIVIGEGDIEKGAFSEVPWSTEDIWIEIAIHDINTSDFKTISNSKLYTVPYAFHANTAFELVDNVNGPGDGVPSQVWSLFGNSNTDSTTDKLGTTDYTDLVFVTDNLERLRITAEGTIEIAGSLDVKKDLSVGRDVFLNYDDNFSPAGETFNNGDFTVDNQSSTYLTGTLAVDGISALNDQVTINANVTGGESNYDAYPLRIEGSNQGLAIKVNKATPDNSNNFVSFFDNANVVRGRIEGETTFELLTNPEYIWDNFVFSYEIFTATADLLIASGDEGIAIAELGQSVVDQVGADTSITNCSGVGGGAGAVVVNVTCIPIPSLIAASIPDIVVKSANLAVTSANLITAGLNEAEAIALPIAYNVFKHTQIGVTYQSGAGDYAEWLPKVNLKSKFYPGDIVGIKAGRISRNTSDSEMNMVISSNPIVLGNMPKDGKEFLYEKIAFMGQVPVKVHGNVNEGDYIIPSGNNDGFGIAVSPENLKSSDYQKIVGIAWTSSNSTQLNYVNVAVGLNSNDVSRLLVKQEKIIEQQANEMNKLKTRLDKMDIFLAKLDAGYNYDVQYSDIKTPENKNPEDTNYEENEQSIAYSLITEEQLEEGIKIAETQLRNQGVDIDNHPFFMKLKSDPNYKNIYMTGIISGYKKEVQRRAEMDRKAGIHVHIIEN